MEKKGAEKRGRVLIIKDTVKKYQRGAGGRGARLEENLVVGTNPGRQGILFGGGANLEDRRDQRAVIARSKRRKSSVGQERVIRQASFWKESNPIPKGGGRPLPEDRIVRERRGESTFVSRSVF